jgi:hypothetical protein
MRWTVENTPSPQSSRHLNERKHSEDFNTGTLRSVESVRGGCHRVENRRKINAYTYARVESVREGRRRIDDRRKRIRTNQSGQQQSSQEKSNKETRNDRNEGRKRGKTESKRASRERSPTRSSLQDLTYRTRRAKSFGKRQMREFWTGNSLREPTLFSSLEWLEKGSLWPWGRREDRPSGKLSQPQNL